MGQTVELLENALRAWEDLMLFEEARVQPGVLSGRRPPEELQGPIKHWRELRKQLLYAPATGLDYSRFSMLSVPANANTIAGKRNLYHELPFQLASWTTSSRRIFNVSKELLERFLSADYSNYRWSDLLWPFDSFGINLETPISVYDTKGELCALPFVLVTSICGVCENYPLAEPDGLEVGFFYTARDGQSYPNEFWSTQEHERLNDDLRHKRWDKVKRRLMRLTPVLQEAIDGFRLPPGNGDPIVLKKEGLVTAEVKDMGKVIAGLCLYLEALPSGAIDGYSWHTSPSIKAKRELRKIITDGAEICQVNDFHTISPETMNLFPEILRQGPAYAVTPHWRRAHYRRPRGQGRNPHAEKTVLVKASLIHGDQLPEGVLPGGAVSKVR